MKKLHIIIACLLLAMPLSAKTVGVEIVSKTADYTVPAGARSVVFVFSTDFTGTVGGVAWVGTTDASFSPPIQSGDTSAAIAVVVTTESVRIITTR